MKSGVIPLFLCYRMKNRRTLDICGDLAYTNINDSNGAVGIYPQCLFKYHLQKRRSLV